MNRLNDNFPPMKTSPGDGLLLIIMICSHLTSMGLGGLIVWVVMR